MAEILELGEPASACALRVTGREALQHGDAVGKVPVDRSDRGTGTFGDHRGGEPLVADLVDDMGGRVEQGRESCGAPRLDRLVANLRDRVHTGGDDRSIHHGVLLRTD